MMISPEMLKIEIDSLLAYFKTRDLTTQEIEFVISQTDKLYLFEHWNDIKDRWADKVE